MNDLGNTFDSRELLERVEAFESEHEEALAAIALHPEDSALKDAVLALTEIDHEEYDMYVELKHLCDSESSEFNSGTTCILDEYFEEYAEELVIEIGDLPKTIPSYIVIDWTATASNIQQDYTSFVINNDTYWYRE